ncbi:MAG: hypothetical protein ABR538_09195 [Candidatus Binatia bacterium]
MFPNSRVVFAFAAAGVLLGAGLTLRSEAACNPPPPGPASNPGFLGGIDSPFLLPGAVRTLTGPTSFSNADAVTIAYFPPAGSNGEKTLLVLRASCKEADGSEWNAGKCSANIPVTYCAEVDVVAENPSTTEHLLRFTVPSYAGEGNPPWTKVIPTPDPKVYRTGPLRLAVSPAGKDVPCWMADPAQHCSSSPAGDLSVCIEKITPPVGLATWNEVESLTGLPAINEFSKFCEPKPGVQPRPCLSGKDQLKFAVDIDGSILIPMGWRDLIRRQGNPNEDCEDGDTDCDTRQVLAATTLPAFKGGATAIVIPPTDAHAVQSFNLNGQVFAEPPNFIVDPSSTQSELVLSGDTDKNSSVLRISVCPGGSEICLDSVRYFAVAHRMISGVGPGILPRSGRCDDAEGAPCSAAQPCAKGSACVKSRGEANQFTGPRKGTPPPPPPPPPPPVGETGGGLSVLWLLAAVVIGLTWYWYLKQK